MMGTVNLEVSGCIWSKSHYAKRFILADDKTDIAVDANVVNPRITAAGFSEQAEINLYRDPFLYGKAYGRVAAGGNGQIKFLDTLATKLDLEGRRQSGGVDHNDPGKIQLPSPPDDGPGDRRGGITSESVTKQKATFRRGFVSLRCHYGQLSYI